MFRGLLVLSVMPRRLKIPASELVKWHHSDITMAQRFQSTHNGKAPVHSDPNAKRKSRLLDDDHIEALREFADDDEKMRGYYPDSKVFGLTVFLGAKSTVWRFRQQSRTKGKRSSVFKTLGNWPAMDVDEARKQALIYSGAVAAGTAAPGKRQAMPFKTAFESYLTHLKAQAEAKGKTPRWWANACKLSETHIMPQWDGWTLAEMSQNPRAVKT